MPFINMRRKFSTFVFNDELGTKNHMSSGTVYFRFTENVLETTLKIRVLYEETTDKKTRSDEIRGACAKGIPHLYTYMMMILSWIIYTRRTGVHFRYQAATQ